jgi:hypothetical protein
MAGSMKSLFRAIENWAGWMGEEAPEPLSAEVRALYSAQLREWYLERVVAAEWFKSDVNDDGTV